MAHIIADAALEKLATDVVILDLRALDAVTDCFVICTGDVDQHVRAISDNIEKQVKAKTSDRLLHREGVQTLNWVILDYVNVVVHIFKPTFREFYRLENLWGDSEVIAVDQQTPAKLKSAMRRSTKPDSAEARKGAAVPSRKSSSRGAKSR